MYPKSSLKTVMRFIHWGLYYTRILFSKIVLDLNTLASLITGGLFHSLIQVAFNLHWVFIISSCGSFSYMTPEGSPSPYDLVEMCSITMSPSQNTPNESCGVRHPQAHSQNTQPIKTRYQKPYYASKDQSDCFKCLI